MQTPYHTPVLFLIFNRPDTTWLVFEQLKKAKPKYLFIAADAPRKEIAGEAEKCREARDIVNHVDWDCEVKTLFRDQNLGCGPAVSSAISWFFDQVEEGIILEDDCFPDLSFFGYCAELLAKYRNVNEVMLIGGNNFQNGIQRGEGSYYFTHYPEIWGWASWRRAWALYDFNMNGLDDAFENGNLKHAFTTAQEKRFWHKKFSETRAGKNNTWDYQFMFSILKSGGVAISPQVNLVKNIGIANNPTHVALRDTNKDLTTGSVKLPLKHPEMVVMKAADHYTFSRIYSRSPQRLWRLVKENGVKNFILYILRSLLK